MNHPLADITTHQDIIKAVEVDLKADIVIIEAVVTVEVDITIEIITEKEEDHHQKKVVVDTNQDVDIDLLKVVDTLQNTDLQEDITDHGDQKAIAVFLQHPLEAD